MSDLDRAAAACAVLIDDGGEFRHLATAWCIAPGEWLTIWDPERPRPESLALLVASTGTVLRPTDWEQEDDQPVVAFRADADCASLALAGEGVLRKRQPLRAIGYPAVIEHPLFSLHRGSLDAERYLPYLCPWQIDGHLALFGLDEGHLTGRCHDGMAGSPVLAEGAVVGMVIDGGGGGDLPPLTRFRRLV